MNVVQRRCYRLLRLAVRGNAMTIIAFEPIKELWLMSLPWLGEAILVAQDHSGAAYVPLKDLCQCVCQRPTSASHEQRLLAHPQLAPATRSFVLIDGRSHWCLREEAAEYWLLTVWSRSLRPALRPVVARLRAEHPAQPPLPLTLPRPVANFTAGYAGTVIRAFDQRLQQAARECFQLVTTSTM